MLGVRNFLLGASVAVSVVLLAITVSANSNASSSVDPTASPANPAEATEPLMLAELRVRVRVFLEGFFEGGALPPVLSPPTGASASPPPPAIGLARAKTTKPTMMEGDSDELVVTTDRPLASSEAVVFEVVGAGDEPPGEYRLSPQMIEGPTTGMKTMVVFSRPDDDQHEPGQAVKVRAHVVTKTAQPTTVASSEEVPLVTEDEDALRIEAPTTTVWVAPGGYTTVTVSINTRSEVEVAVYGPGIALPSLESLQWDEERQSHVVNIMLRVEAGIRPEELQDRVLHGQTMLVVADVFETGGHAELLFNVEVLWPSALTMTAVPTVASVPEGTGREGVLTLNRPLRNGERISIEVVGEDGASAADYFLSPAVLEGPTTATQMVWTFSALHDGLHEATETFALHGHAAYRSTPSAPIRFMQRTVARFEIPDNDALTIAVPPQAPLEAGKSRTFSATLNTLLEAKVSMRVFGVRRWSSQAIAVWVVKPAGTRTVEIPLQALPDGYDTWDVTVTARTPVTGAQATTRFNLKIEKRRQPLMVQLSAERTTVREGESVRLPLTTNRDFVHDEEVLLGTGTPDNGEVRNFLRYYTPLRAWPRYPHTMYFLFEPYDDGDHEAPQTHTLFTRVTRLGTGLDHVLFSNPVQITVHDNDALVVEAPQTVQVVAGEPATVTLTFNTDLEVEVTPETWLFESEPVTKPAGVRTLELPLITRPDWWPGRPRITYTARVARTGAEATAAVVVDVLEPAVPEPLQIELTAGSEAEEGVPHELLLTLSRPLLAFERVRFHITEPYDNRENALPGHRELAPSFIQGPTKTTQMTAILSTREDAWHEPTKAYVIQVGMDERDYWNILSEHPHYYDRGSSGPPRSEKITVWVRDNDVQALSVTPTTVIPGESFTAEVALNTMWRSEVTGPDGEITVLDTAVVWGGSALFTEALATARELLGTASAKVEAARGEQRSQQASGSNYQADAALWRVLEQLSTALDRVWLDLGLLNPGETDRMGQSRGNRIGYDRGLVPASIEKPWGALLEINYSDSDRYNDPAPLRTMNPALPENYTVWDAMHAVSLGLEATIAGLEALVAESLDASVRVSEVELSVPAGASQAAVSAWTPATKALSTAVLYVQNAQMSMDLRTDKPIIQEGETAEFTLLLDRPLAAGEAAGVAVSKGGLPVETDRVLQGPTTVTQVTATFRSVDDDLHEGPETFLFQPVMLVGASSPTVKFSGGPVRLTVIDNDALTVEIPDPIEIPVTGAKTFPVTLNTELEAEIYIEESRSAYSSWLHLPDVRTTKEAGVRSADVTLTTDAQWNREGHAQVEVRVPATGAVAKTAPAVHIVGRPRIVIRMQGEEVIYSSGSTQVTVVLSRPLLADEYLSLGVYAPYHRGGTATKERRDGPTKSIWAARAKVLLRQSYERRRDGPTTGTELKFRVDAPPGSDSNGLHDVDNIYWLSPIVYIKRPDSWQVGAERTQHIVFDADALTVEVPASVSIGPGASRIIAVSLNTFLETRISMTGPGIHPAAITKGSEVRTVNIVLSRRTDARGASRVTVHAHAPRSGGRATATIDLQSVIVPLTAGLSPPVLAVREDEVVELVLTLNRPPMTGESVGIAISENGLDRGIDRVLQGPTTVTQMALRLMPDDLGVAGNGLHEEARVFELRPVVVSEGSLREVADEVVRVTVADEDPLVIETVETATTQVKIGQSTTLTLTLNTDLQTEVTVRGTGVKTLTAVKPAGVRTLDVAVAVLADAQPGTAQMTVAASVPATGAEASTLAVVTAAR